MVGDSPQTLHTPLTPSGATDPPSRRGTTVPHPPTIPPPYRTVHTCGDGYEEDISLGPYLYRFRTTDVLRLGPNLETGQIEKEEVLPKGTESS